MGATAVRDQPLSEEMIDATLADSFPASDPPSWTQGRDRYHSVNNGVYRAGFATTQEAYEEAAFGVFAMLDELEVRLASSRYLFGDRPLETDWPLFTTLIRFDAVYFGHFKCNLRRLVDYPNLTRYTRDLYQLPRIAETVNFDHIRRHYYTSHRAINPNGIVPIGPELNFAGS